MLAVLIGVTTKQVLSTYELPSVIFYVVYSDSSWFAVREYITLGIISNACTCVETNMYPLTL